MLPRWLPAVILLGLCSCTSRDAAQVPARDSTTAATASVVGPSVKPATAEEILNAVKEPGSKAVLVNVWATWCAPCREEFPDLMRVYQDYRERGLKLVLVSADFDDQLPEARRFLARNGVNFGSYLKVGDDMQFINTLSPKWTGALPATFIYDGEGRLRYFREGRATLETLQQQVLQVLGAPGEEKS